MREHVVIAPVADAREETDRLAGSTRDRAWRLALVVLLAATLLTRIPFLSTVPFNGDSTHYLLGMERFDPVEARPHPPGYPLYVLAGKALWIVVGDPHRALVLLSVAASVVAVWAIVRLGSALGTRAVGLWAGVLLAVNPMFWLHGELALSYSVEIAGAILVALAAWGSYTRPSGRAAVWLALAFAVLGGFRPPVLVLLAPVYLFGLVRLGWRDRALAVGITGAVVLAWLVPLVELSGGVATYVEVARRQGEIAGGQTSPLLGGDWAVWASNISLFAVALVGAVHVVPLVALAAFVRRRPRRISARAALLWLWLAPALLTFVLVHFGQIGYILLPLPPMLLLSLFAIEGAWPAQVASRRPALVLVVCIVASLWFASIALTTLQDNEAAWRQIRAALRTRPPEETLVLARVSGGGSFQAAAWVLQDLRVVGLTGSDEAARGARYEAQGGQWSYQLDHPHPVCQVVALRGARRVAVLDDLLAGWVPDPARWQRIDLPNGEPLLLRDVPPGATVVDLSRGTIELAERDAATC